jgi:tetraacyldisaccharide 4'-kinase
VQAGERVGYWSHGYRGRGGVVRRVDPGTPAGEVGDEAVLAARELAPLGVPVWVGPASRALPVLARRGGVIVADGLRVARSAGARVLLALDEEAPWGAGVCPPAGDLRAPVGELLRAASEVLGVGTGEPRRLPGGWWRGRWGLDASAARGVPVAVVTAVARPERFVGALRRAGVEVATRVELPDHGGPGAAEEAAARLRGQRFEAVLCTEKCALWLGPTLLGRPVVALRCMLELPPGLARAMAAGSGGRNEAAVGTPGALAAREWG